jgi:hypothetical protein
VILAVVRADQLRYLRGEEKGEDDGEQQARRAPPRALDSSGAEKFNRLAQRCSHN